MSGTTRRQFLEMTAAGATGVVLGSFGALPTAEATADAARTAVFSEARIGSLRLANRLVRASTAEGASPGGRMNEAGLEIYSALAAGGVGLILTGHMVAVAGGDAHANQTHIHGDDSLPDLRRITDAVHGAAASCPVVAEISHAGQAGVVDPVVPSPIPTRPGGRTARVLSEADVEGLVAQFVSAVVRARESGFDGVEIHAAHGYLLASFLSPRLNRREDAWGGSPERRARIVRDIVAGARTLVGPEYPILIKMNGNDQGTGDQAAEGFAVAAREVERAGIDAIEVSGRMPCRPDIDTPEEEAYFLEFTERLEVGVPVALTGGHRSLDRIAAVLANPRIDLVGVARPVIREPDLPTRWRAGDGPATAACISCNRCLKNLGNEPTHCVVQELLREARVA